MRHAWKCVLFCTAVALAWQAPASANLLTNPSFDSGDFTGWSQWHPENTTINNWGPGGFSAAGWWQTSAWQDVTVIDPNTEYLIRGEMFDDVAGGESLSNGAYAQIRVEFKNSSDEVVGIWTTGNITGADLFDNIWNIFAGFVTPATYGPGITRATFVWEVNNTGTGSGRGIFDEFAMVGAPVPEVAGWVMLSMGLLGLGVVSYRRI